jgi:ribosomal protein S18 acetylase RimI-like enzyme
MKYKLENSSINDIELIKQYKLKSIFDYADNISEEEDLKIRKYIDKFLPNSINDYKNIVIDGKINGCLLLTNKDNNLLLDEIYIEKKYQGKGIGTDIIKSILKEHNEVYLYVYKKNTNAINLYKKLGFKIHEETLTRYYMKYKKLI